MRAIWVDEVRHITPIAAHCPQCGLEVWEAVDEWRVRERAPWMCVCERCHIYFPVNALTTAEVRAYYDEQAINGGEQANL